MSISLRDIVTTWTHLRNIVDDKHLPIQYEYNTDGYEIFAVDNGVVYTTVIYNNAVPDTTLYSQAQNDSDKSDFLANYAPSANKVMQAYAARDGYTTNLYPILQGGTDGGGIVRIFRTDTSSRQVIVGAGTAGTPTGGVLTVQGDPSGTALPISGTVTANQGGSWTVAATQSGSWTVTANAGTGTFNVAGTVTVTQSTSSNLKAQVEGLQADGTAISSNPIVVAGQDGTNIQSLATDGYGNLLISSLNAHGSPPSAIANPVLVAGWDGTNVVRLRLNANGTVATSNAEFATFTTAGTAIGVANNKSMISVFNADAVLLAKIHEIYVVNVQTAAVTGVTGVFELRRITSHSGGTLLTPTSMDSTDSLDSDITVRTGATVGGESANLMWRSLFSTDEWGPGTVDTESNDHIFQTMHPIFSRKTDSGTKSLVLRQNEGLTIKFATNSSAGTFDIFLVFTQE